MLDIYIFLFIKDATIVNIVKKQMLCMNTVKFWIR